MSFDSWLFIISFLATILAALSLLLKLPRFWVDLSDPLDVVKSLGVFLFCLCALMYSLNVLEPVSNRIKNNIIDIIEEHKAEADDIDTQEFDQLIGEDEVVVENDLEDEIDIEKVKQMIAILENYSRNHSGQ